MSKADVLLKKATSFEKLAIYSDRKTFLQAIAQTYPDPNASVDPTAFSNSETSQWDSQTQPRGIPAPDPSLGDPGDPFVTSRHQMDAPAVREQDKPQQRIDPQIQSTLGLSPDGILGPATRKALDSYKQRMRMPNATDQQAFDQIKKDTHEMTRGTAPRGFKPGT